MTKRKAPKGKAKAHQDKGKGKRPTESDDPAPTRVKLAVSRSQEEEQQDVQMASTSADPLQGITSSATQEIRDVELVAPHPGIDIMEEEQQDVQMASTSADPLRGITSATQEIRDVELVAPSHPRIDIMEDVLSDEQSAQLNSNAATIYPWEDDTSEIIRTLRRVHLLVFLSDQSLNINREYCDPSSVRKLLDREPWLIPVIDKHWKEGSLHVIPRLRILQRTEIGSSSSEPIRHPWTTSTELSWAREFEGTAVNLLLETISTYLTKEPVGYAHCSTIVNSSGTGKSRTIDQLSKRIITVSICLRAHGTGFPPPDSALRDWLISKPWDRPAIMKRFHGFVYSLLTVTRERLQELVNSNANGLREGNGMINQENLADAFRDRMTKGQEFGGTGQYRQDFFKLVIERADFFVQHSESPSDDTQIDLRVPKLRDDYVTDLLRKGVHEAGEALTNFIKPPNIKSPKGRRSDSKLLKPLVVLAFDEAHVLANPASEDWSLFSELRRVLRQLYRAPIFTLFLSTASKFQAFNPDRRSEPSRRIADDRLVPLPPITEIGFDALAYTAEEGVTTIEEVSHDKWMSHLGRPLFGAIYDTSEMDPDWRLNDIQEAVLACLSVRFGLEFDLSDPNTRAVQITQVERHLRLCLAASPGLDCLLTAAGSEPFLAKAAADLIHRSPKTSAQHLASHGELNCIDRGQRGELVASLLIMQARDDAYWNNEPPRHDWMHVMDFMRALLPQEKYEMFIDARPAYYQSETQDASFGTTFRDSKMWFNHVIQLDKGEMIHVSQLWKFLSRGAMIICPPGHYGIDIVLPVCYQGNSLERGNMTAILIQVQNATRFGKNISGKLFPRMNPFDVGLVSKGDHPLPIIRMVFALGSNKCGIAIAPQPVRRRGGNFTAYDIWCAGMSAETFACVRANDQPSYVHLLLRSLQANQAYNLVDIPKMFTTPDSVINRGNARRSLRALAGPEPAHNDKYEETVTATSPVSDAESSSSAASSAFSE
ncbi:hypothetical protein BC826DRAFT_1031818 [Russula brevipes]|nr:hypothetical protein BC826DRAFT_1031818 [Russula brevipes]